MKKLKIVLLFSFLFITFLINFFNSKPSLYKNEKIIFGTVISIKKNNDKMSFIINGREKVLINYYGDYECNLGDKVKVYGKLSEPRNNTVFYLFNYKNYLLSKNIKKTFTASKIKTVSKNKKYKYKIKNSLIKYLSTFKSKKYLMTFILGNDDEIEQEVLESYQKSGIIHLFAISGMQIALLSSILLYILSKIFSRQFSFIILSIFLLFYLFLTDFSPSVLRSVLLFIILNLKRELNIKIPAVYIIMLLFLILINYNPYYIYSLGFILSFTVSFYLTLFKDIIKRFNNYFYKTLIISSIAFISSSPIIINSYFSLNLLSPFLNIIFASVVSFIIYPLALLTLFFRPLDILLNKITYIFERLSLFISNLDFLTLTLSHISLYIEIFYYFLITVLLYVYKEYRKNYLWVFIVVLFIHHNISFLNSNTIVTYIDVKQGDSILIKEKKYNILIDTGGNIDKKDNNISKKTLIPYLMSVGVNKLDYLIITHGDADHMGEAINLVNNFKVEKVIFNCGPFNDLEKDLIKVLDKKKIKYYSCIKELNIDNNKLYFLQTKEYDNENDNSNVIYTELDGYKFMFMGDASITTEKEILNKYSLSNIDVLKVGHHGSRTSSGKEFINEINSKYSVISVGKNNRYGHPNKEVLNNLDDSKIYRTDQDGSIMFKIKNKKLEIETCNP